MNLSLFVRRLGLTTLLALGVGLVACSSSTTSSGPACTGASEGGACKTASDCKPAACKCVDGTGSDTATNRVCVNSVCDAQSLCDNQCVSHGGTANSATCS